MINRRFTTTDTSDPYDKPATTRIVDDPGNYARCSNPQHNPPGMIVIPDGKMLIHTCPGCGKVTTVRRTRATL